MAYSTKNEPTLLATHNHGGEDQVVQGLIKALGEDSRALGEICFVLQGRCINGTILLYNFHIHTCLWFMHYMK